MNQQIKPEKAKQLFVKHLNKFKSSEVVDSNKLQIIDTDQFDIVLYNLKTTVKTEIYVKKVFPLDTDNIFNLISLNLNPNLQSNFIIESCTNCDGNKYIKCQTCTNYNLVKDTINESIHHHEINHMCSNHFQNDLKENINCNQCNNSQLVECQTCKGLGQIKYIKYRTDKNHYIDDVIINCKDNSLPLKVILKGKGSILVDQTIKKLNPISNYPDRNVYERCKDLLVKHDEKLRKSPDWQLVNQSHQLVAIPAALYTIKFKSKTVKFYIIGENEEVYYPNKESCCSIC